jgi:DNA repair protein RAD51
MIRTIDDKEVENMKSAIDPFTHIKIQLSKNSSKFKGKIYWALNEEYFFYKIHVSGMVDCTEDI